MNQSLVHIHHPYLLVTNIPYFEDDSGHVFLDRLWHHDLVRHTTYLSKLVLAAPALRERTDPDWVRIEEPIRSKIRFVALPDLSTFQQALLTLPQTIARLSEAVESARIVHVGVAGWPFPLGWIATTLARWHDRRIIVIVESAPWRTPDGSTATTKARVKGFLYERMARFVCEQADVGLYTQPEYMRTLGGGERGKNYVTPATWIDEHDVLDPLQAEASWDKKADSGPRMLFAGRFHADKGVRVLLDALGIVDRRQVPLQLDFIGAGDLQATIDSALAGFRHVRVRRLEPVPNGAPFFQLIDQYHALVVPSLADEQPRIVFDAFARAVPLIASDTDGLKPYIDDGQTGVLVRRGDAVALSEALVASHADGGKLRRMGLAAVECVRSHTHRAMHEMRSQLIAKHLLR